MDCKALHFVADLYKIVETNKINDLNFCTELVKKAIETAGCHILNIFTHKFNPQGLSINVTLSESHFAIHTWPEKNYCAVDFYGCGKDVNIRAGIQVLIDGLAPRKYKITKLIRGEEA